MAAKRDRQVRDPEATKKRILAAARHEFAKYGLGGARVDRIASRAKSNKRMLYHYFGNKEDLFRRTLEDAYGQFRVAEAALMIEKDDPVTAIKRLVAFTWNYYVDNPELIPLVNSENLHKARHLKTSDAMDKLNKPFIARMQSLLDRGVAEGLFRKGLDAVQVLITMAGVNYHYLTNQFTGEIVYGRPLMTPEARKARLAFNVSTILRLVCTPDTLKRIGE
ncbi:MAG: TetR family transcriptional regulator [Proteobacteria bacterium]|nr:TetR family transcriptional regulator [Pseudomonadota bacterium]